jgi:hypothetical protein
VLGNPGFESRQCQRIFPSSLKRSFGAHPASYSISTRALFPGTKMTKRSGRVADQSPTFSADVKNEWSHTSTPPVYIHGLYTNSYARFQASAAVELRLSLLWDITQRL